MADRPPPTSTAQRSAQTADLIARKATDVARWREPQNLASQWDERARLAASLMTDARSVLDVGAGAMALRDFLRPGVAYHPADVVSRCEGCFVADLNQGQFPSGQYDYVSFLGVLEYIHDPAWPLRAAASHAPRLVVSYCADTSGDEAYRRGLGWVNDLTEAGFEALLAETGWSAEARVEYKRGPKNTQSLWKCRRREAPRGP